MSGGGGPSTLLRHDRAVVTRVGVQAPAHGVVHELVDAAALADRQPLLGRVAGRVAGLRGDLVDEVRAGIGLEAQASRLPHPGGQGSGLEGDVGGDGVGPGGYCGGGGAGGHPRSQEQAGDLSWQAHDFPFRSRGTGFPRLAHRAAPR